MDRATAAAGTFDRNAGAGERKTREEIADT